MAAHRPSRDHANPPHLEGRGRPRRPADPVRPRAARGRRPRPVRRAPRGRPADHGRGPPLPPAARPAGRGARPDLRLARRARLGADRHPRRARRVRRHRHPQRAARDAARDGRLPPGRRAARPRRSTPGLLAAERLGVPHGRIAIMAHAMETWSLPVVAPALDAHRERLGLHPDPDARPDRRAARGSPRFPEALEGPADVAPAHGLRFREPDLAPPFDPGVDPRPLVYATYGSVSPSRCPSSRSCSAPPSTRSTTCPARVLFTVAGAPTARARTGAGERARGDLGPAGARHAARRGRPLPRRIGHDPDGAGRRRAGRDRPRLRRPAAQRRAGRRDGRGHRAAGWPAGLAGIGDAVRRVLEEPSYARAAAGRLADEVAALPPVSGRHRSDAPAGSLPRVAA